MTRVRRGNLHACLPAHPAHYAVITPIGLLDHLTKLEILQAFDDVAAPMTPGEFFVDRVPYAVSPPGEHIRSVDFTHQPSLIARSVHQLAASVRFGSVLSHSSPPISHCLASAAVWRVVSCYRISLAAGTGRLRDRIITKNFILAACKNVKLVSPGEKNP